ncbi:oligogalacturonate-specific porin KdgM family protein [Shewanella olleyana]|uniref:oligogalacturonate-specific porin KdgM family protein n=1 Tax=Shewanella olleyana TaxID=135626 RepID=UPI00200DC6C4|nr:oligogalacturonate-specific porin KdgM family protein [Shewanella olleyana]MCL1067437.1 oligogalacturonate-specific porin KdgM family protein [Shewanella olleyana]
MKKSILALSVISIVGGSALVGTSAAANTTMTFKWEHKLLDGRTDRPKFEFSHRMDNGFNFGFEQVWQYDRSKQETEVGFAPEQYEFTLKTGYRHRWGDRNEHEVGPLLDYQVKENAKKIRFGAFYGYRLTKDFSMKVRARYSGDLERVSVGSGTYDDAVGKEMRYDLWLTYRWNDFTFVWDAIYKDKLDDNVFDNNEGNVWEHELSAEYRLPDARAHAFYGKFKYKAELLKNSHLNSEYDWYGKRDNAVEIGYKYRF